ncbi:MAG: Holliday junction resolvase RuvX [Henriciella sp.]|nr:Holliday junction resolvase RuvX [Henriciella sp.]
MPELNLSELPTQGPLLGIDPGSKTIGVAGSDGLRMIASPLEIIPRGRKLRPALLRLFDLYDARESVGLVVGLPYNLDGTSGPRVQAAKALSLNILQFRDIPLAFQDERLSSAEAERVMIDADLSRARRAETLDASAAAIILQTALDRLANQTP